MTSNSKRFSLNPVKISSKNYIAQRIPLSPVKNSSSSVSSSDYDSRATTRSSLLYGQDTLRDTSSSFDLTLGSVLDDTSDISGTPTLVPSSIATSSTTLDSSSPSRGCGEFDGHKSRRLENGLSERNSLSKQPPSGKYGPFKYVNCRSKGSYGIACALKDMSTGKVFCAKTYTKSKMFNSKGKRTERFNAALSELASYRHISLAEENERKWLMELHGIMQDDTYVMFFMDLMFMELYSLIQRQKIHKPVARQILAQIALGINALHNMGIIHRDIKPENIFITPGTTNIRIGDFTNAWLAPLNETDSETASFDSEFNERMDPLVYWKVYAFECAGTPQYLAPEMTATGWYGCMVDWWALGALAFELMSRDRSLLFPEDGDRIQYKSWVIDEHKSPELYLKHRDSSLDEEEIHLLAGLLQPNPSLRSRFEHLAGDPYFFDESGASVISQWHNIPTSLTRQPPFHLNHQINQDGMTSAEREIAAHEGEGEKYFNVEPEPCRSSRRASKMQKGSAQSDFELFAWISPNGLWSSSA
ncbi:hypothetical protein ABKN59_006597 [Abortiporus biennis]